MVIQAVKVLVLLSSSGRGGREVNTVRLIPYLQRKGLGVEVVILDVDGYVSRWCREHDVPCHLPGRFLPVATVRLFRLVKKLRPDLVHVYGFYAGMMARFIARLAGIKVIVGIVGAGHFGRWRCWLERWTAPLVDLYVANSYRGGEKLLEIIGEKRGNRVVVVQNGVPLEFPPPGVPMKGEECVVIGSLGNLRPEKGYGTMLAALQKLVEDFKGSFIYLVGGEGKLRSQLEKQAAVPGLEGKVKFLGLIEDTWSFLHYLDLFVLPSYSEGLPNALLEAMAAGRCVVATRVGGVPEIIESGVHGILVEAGDTARLTEAIRELMLAPERRRMMGERAGERVRSFFTLEKQAAETVRVYKRMVSS